MSKLITLLIIEFLEGLFDFLGNKMLTGIVPLALHAEQYMKGLGIGGFDNLFKVFLDFGISMIILKFLKKGFEMYILWTDGDADADPVLLLSNFFRAMAIALTFPILYDWLAEITTDLSQKILEVVGLNANMDFAGLLANMSTGGLFSVLSFLVFFIIFILLYIQFIKNGLEILILRIGVPLACIGLMDADKGVFKTYIQKFFQAIFTVIVQLLLAKLGLALMFSGHMIWGIAANYFAVKTPHFLQEFLIIPGGGGITNNLYSSARLMQMLKSAVK
ncbi:conjugal transfer protein TrbL family protein [Xylanivirga thermophila]|uniref:conjugal transfer protein TrbL family protein n=1 Tax=Xylanivirga thermophila TaxID=2496273 RepID=UPI00101D1F34|nr:conjugal transfer protein TrbL family protein [Xylanivirga thermophila]